jgi:hypothetical protein
MILRTRFFGKKLTAHRPTGAGRDIELATWHRVSSTGDVVIQIETPEDAFFSQMRKYAPGKADLLKQTLTATGLSLQELFPDHRIHSDRDHERLFRGADSCAYTGLRGNILKALTTCFITPKDGSPIYLGHADRRTDFRAKGFVDSAATALRWLFFGIDKAVSIEELANGGRITTPAWDGGPETQVVIGLAGVTALVGGTYIAGALGAESLEKDAEVPSQREIKYLCEQLRKPQSFKGGDIVQRVVQLLSRTQPVTAKERWALSAKLVAIGTSSRDLTELHDSMSLCTEDIEWTRLALQAEQARRITMTSSKPEIEIALKTIATHNHTPTSTLGALWKGTKALTHFTTCHLICAPTIECDLTTAQIEAISTHIVSNNAAGFFDELSQSPLSPGVKERLELYAATRSSEIRNVLLSRLCQDVTGYERVDRCFSSISLETPNKLGQLEEVFDTTRQPDETDSSFNQRKREFVRLIALSHPSLTKEFVDTRLGFSQKNREELFESLCTRMKTSSKVAWATAMGGVHEVMRQFLMEVQYIISKKPPTTPSDIETTRAELQSLSKMFMRGMEASRSMACAKDKMPRAMVIMDRAAKGISEEEWHRSFGYVQVLIDTLNILSMIGMTALKAAYNDV